MANLLANGDFEDGGDYFDSWTYYDNGGGSKAEVTGANSTASALRLDTSSGSNVQLYQSGISLTQGTEYRLMFYGYHTNYQDCKAIVRLHASPFTIIGLNTQINLVNFWQLHTLVFTATQTTSNARLQIQLNPFAESGESYYLDEFDLDVNPPPVPDKGLRIGTRIAERIGVSG